MKSLIIGAGEVGTALKTVISKAHEVLIRDVEPIDIGPEHIEVLHICYPDGKAFVKATKAYIELYYPKLTIIHSSIGIGTLNKLDDEIVYSPIRGRHMRLGKLSLADDIQNYVKFVFCNDELKKRLAHNYFEECGLTCYSFSNPIIGEALKLISNVHMGLEIAWRQEVERILKKFTIPASIYEIWENSYYDGYKKCGDEHLIRSRMKPDPIGGHCILPCLEILKNQFDSKFFDLILESNEKAKQENKI